MNQSADHGSTEGSAKGKLTSHQRMSSMEGFKHALIHVYLDKWVRDVEDGGVDLQ